jgi:hypothetical protein
MPLKPYEVEWGPTAGAIILIVGALWLLWLKFRSRKDSLD